MCGFVGVVAHHGDLNIDRARKAQNSIIHRGPDYQGSYTDNKRVFLGHNRLSIIDLSERSNQPMFSKHAQVVIIFNGEIYNYKELRSQFPENHFGTESDTEVVMEGFLKEGKSFFKKLRGIYAFAIYDFRNDLEVTMARDPSGVKPMYLLHGKEQLIVSSEIKAIKIVSTVSLTRNIDVLQSYLQVGYCPEPQTAYNEITAIEPGRCVQWNERDGLKSERFHTIKIDQNNKLSQKENHERVESLLSAAIKRNLTADVTCSVALSGGIDSSLVYYYSHEQDKKIQGLTVSFTREEGYNEASLSRQYAEYLNGEHHILEATVDAQLEKFHNLLLHFDQPYADTSLFPVYSLTQSCRNFGKVLIGGDGGDELFNGYPFMHLIRSIFKYNKGNFLKALMPLAISASSGGRKRQLTRVNDVLGLDLERALINMNSWIPESSMWEGRKVLTFDPKSSQDYMSNIFADEKPSSIEDYITFYYYRHILLSDYLRKTDMMSMLNGIELRVPLLDEDLTQFAFTIPSKQKSSLKRTKKILRDIHMEKYNGLGTNSPKTGFEIPLDKYLTRAVKDHICNELTQQSGNIINEYVDRQYVKFLCDQFVSKDLSPLISRGGLYQRIVVLYSLKLWNDSF